MTADRLADMFAIDIHTHATVSTRKAAGTAKARTRVLLLASDASDPPGVMGRQAQGPALVGRFDDLPAPDAEGRWLICERRASFHVVVPGQA